MAIDRRNRIAFEEVADLYAEMRPGYPPALFDEMVAFAGLPAGGRVLEIGCGPGNATLPMAERGYHILAVELGARLAAHATRTCQPYRGRVEFHVGAFEDWPLQERAFDLVMAADSLHWISPEFAYPQAAAALKDLGAVAFFWHVPVEVDGPLADELNAVYAAFDPEVENPDRAYSLGWVSEIIRENFHRSGCFAEPQMRTYAWAERMQAREFTGLLRTYSGHRGLEPAQRRDLYAGIRAAIERHGGTVARTFRVAMFLAKLKR